MAARDFVTVFSLYPALMTPTVSISVAGSLAGEIAPHLESHRPAGREILMAGDMEPPPDYEAVMAKEFRSAVKKGTSAALIRFISRHPEHPLADRARSLLAGRHEPDARPASGPDADIHAAFDEARRRDTAEAYAAFIAEHANHPLAAEARRRISDLNRGGAAD